VRGTPLAVRAFVRALAFQGHEVDLLTFPQGAVTDLAGARHLRSLGLPVGRVRPGASLAKLLLDVPFMAEAALRMAFGRYDVVHAVEEAAFLAAPMARLLRLPLVVDVDSAIPDQLRESGFARGGPILWLAEALERHALDRACAVVTVCASLTERVRGIAPQVQVFQVEDPPLVDPDTPPSADEVAAARATLGLGDGPVVFYSGNFEPYQGVSLLVGAMAHVPGARCLFVGGEPADIDAMREMASRLGASERCVFAGKRPPSDVPALLALSDVVVSPRNQGVNTPFKIYTYLASGRPIVATRIPTHTQLLDDSLAFLVEPTAEAIAEGIRRALAEPVEARRRAEAGLALIAREYSPRRHAEKVAAAYAAVCSARAPARAR
jgi:glycosyltransferase involved in cell wall biosynthesis